MTITIGVRLLVAIAFAALFIVVKNDRVRPLFLYGWLAALIAALVLPGR